MLASSWGTTIMPLKQGGTALATADRVLAKGPRKQKKHSGLFCHVVIIPFKRH